jgi:hypothetical protein
MGLGYTLGYSSKSLASYERLVLYKHHIDPCGRAEVAVEFVCRAWQQKDSQDWLESTLGKEEFLEEWRSVIALFAQQY